MDFHVRFGHGLFIFALKKDEGEKNQGKSHDQFFEEKVQFHPQTYLLFLLFTIKKAALSFF